MVKSYPETMVAYTTMCYKCAKIQYVRPQERKVLYLESVFIFVFLCEQDSMWESFKCCIVLHIYLVTAICMYIYIFILTLLYMFGY